MKKNIFILSIATLLAATSFGALTAPALSKDKFSVEAAAGYAFNKKFTGPTGSLRAKYALEPISNKLTHGISFEVMVSESKAKKSSGEVILIPSKNGAGDLTGSRVNQVKVTQLPILLNYHLAYALDAERKWTVEASAGVGLQYFGAKQTESHQMFANKQLMSLNDPDAVKAKANKNAYKKVFGTDTGSVKTKKHSWKPVGKFTLGLQYNTAKWNAFVRGFALVSKSTSFAASTLPADKATGKPRVMPANLKWGAVQLGAEAGIGINF